MIVGERYEIISKIGSGGMADVYKAKDHKLNRLVAVKVMKAEFSEDKGFIAKFRDEAQAAAGLAHPNVVNVYDVGEDKGVYYIVMELVQGITLKDYITRKGKLTVREATSIAIQVSLGLEAAHRSNIVHRDVKPQNIIISTDGKVKLSDFGIARAASSNTISSNVMGSVHYSSPEQVRGGYSDAKSDIYSLGITMYEMVTGHVPFDGETTVAIAIKHLQEEIVSPRQYIPDLPYSLEQIILKCTQKSPDRRYGSMSELIEDLKHSLLDPDGRFVMVTPLSSHAQTMQLSKDELEAIRQGRSGYATQRQDSYAPYEEEDDEDYDEDYDDEYEDEDEEQEGDISSKLEKAMTIGGFVIGGIIICILIFLIARAAGFLKFGGTKKTDNDVTIQQEKEPGVVDTEKDENGQVSTPKLVTLTEENALSVLEQMGLKGHKSKEESSSEYPAGTVMKQDIAEGTKINPGTVINYIVSTGVDAQTVPEVKDFSQSEAEAAIKAKGFLTEVKKEYHDTIPVGKVISVSPKAGSSLEKGATVTLTVSLGKENKNIPVPSVVGLGEDVAKKKLTDRGFQTEVTTVSEAEEGTEDGVVLSQSPEASKEKEPGTKVTITVYRKPEEVTASTWSTVVKLMPPENYTDGKVRIRLVQEVNGEEQETVLLEGETLTFPYVLNAQGAEGVETGTIYLDEMVEEEYVERAHYNNVTFKESKS